LSGLLFALSFPKFNLFWLAWVALVPFFYALFQTKNFKERLGVGLAFGGTFFIISFVWILELFRFAGWWVYFGWVALAIFQTFFILLFALAFPLCRRNSFFIALLWIAVEYLRSLGPLGVPFGLVGYSQAGFLPIIQIARFTSVYGVSFLVVLVNAVLADIFVNVGTGLVPVRDTRTAIKAVPTLIVALLLIGSYFYGFVVLSEKTITETNLNLALIQPNIDQKIKIDPDKVDEVFAIYEEMTKKAALEKPEVIIWPETAVYSYLMRDNKYRFRLQELAREIRASLVFGTPHYDGGKSYNSIISMSPAGEVVDRYDKGHLVPFGEYLPFKPLLYPLLKSIGYYESEFASGKTKGLKIGRHNVAASICFESVFPDKMRELAKKKSEFILLVTNDGWFGDSSILPYHINCGIFRAIENRKYFVQASNTGITAVIDPWGRVVQKLKPHSRGILFTKIPLR